MFTEQKKLPNVEVTLKRYPLSKELKVKKSLFDEQIKNNFTDRKKLTVVCGPCSADNPLPMREYLTKLKQAQDNYPDLQIVARIYTTKPHSNGQGYQGTCFHGKIDEKIDLEQGIVRAREIMLDCLKIGLPVADELLYPSLYPYFADLVSYWFVGARSSDDTLHRSFASGVDTCCGVKNGLDGDISKAVDSLYAVSRPCVFPFDGAQISASGCKYAHIVLRGGKNGEDYFENFSEHYTTETKKSLRALGLNDFIMADLSHANSGKIAVNQLKNAELAARNRDIDGVMLESYLYSGVNSDLYGVSKTDDCLCFEDTVKALEILQQDFKRR